MVICECPACRWGIERRLIYWNFWYFLVEAERVSKTPVFKARTDFLVFLVFLRASMAIVPLGTVILVSGAITVAPQPPAGTFARFPRISANEAPTRSMPIFPGISRLSRFARFPRAFRVLANADGRRPIAARATGPGGANDHGAVQKLVIEGMYDRRPAKSRTTVITVYSLLLKCPADQNAQGPRPQLAMIRRLFSHRARTRPGASQAKQPWRECTKVNVNRTDMTRPLAGVRHAR
jgi:hypothetical protein